MENAAPKNNTLKYLLIGILFILFLNVIILDVFLFNFGKNNLDNAPKFETASTECSESCLEKLSEMIRAQENLTSSPSSIQKSSTSAQTSEVKSPTPTPSTSIPKEYFIPLGFGSGMTTDWAEVPGMAVKIDTSKYGVIDKAYFEATVRIPNGNQSVSVRLYNSTTPQYIPNSELTFSGGTPTLSISNPIILSSGNNLYKVQLKTQLQSQVFIDQARIHIITK